MRWCDSQVGYCAHASLLTDSSIPAPAERKLWTMWWWVERRKCCMFPNLSLKNKTHKCRWAHVPHNKRKLHTTLNHDAVPKTIFFKAEWHALLAFWSLPWSVNWSVTPLRRGCPLVGVEISEWGQCSFQNSMHNDVLWLTQEVSSSFFHWQRPNTQANEEQIGCGKQWVTKLNGNNQPASNKWKAWWSHISDFSWCCWCKNTSWWVLQFDATWSFDSKLRGGVHFVKKKSVSQCNTWSLMWQWAQPPASCLDAAKLKSSLSLLFDTCGMAKTTIKDPAKKCLVLSSFVCLAQMVQQRPTMHQSTWIFGPASFQLGNNRMTTTNNSQTL